MRVGSSAPSPRTRAATVNIGAIVGAGYVERESFRSLYSVVQKLHMMRLSEDDWHQSVCEAIGASRLESGHGSELTTGLSEVAVVVVDKPAWFTKILDIQSSSQLRSHKQALNKYWTPGRQSPCNHSSEAA